jgi:3-hydroxyisobutyrate dehydrogenase
MSELIAFIGVGNMGLPMAENLMKSGKKIRVFDVSKNTIEIAQKKNLDVVENLSDLVTTDVTTGNNYAS